MPGAIGLFFFFRSPPHSETAAAVEKRENGTYYLIMPIPQTISPTECP